jgi:hypothetical protein
MADRVETTGSFKAGERLGKEWAKEHAKPAELRGLARLYESWANSPGGFDRLFVESTSHNTPADQIALAIMGGEDEYTATDAREFWERYLNADLAEQQPGNRGYDDFVDTVRGFVDGALEAMDEMELTR